VNRDYGIEDQQVFVVVSDHGSNYVKSLKSMLKYNQFPCICHTIELCILDALRSDKTTWNIYTKAKALVEVFHRCPGLESQLITIQERIVRNSFRSLINENLEQTKKLQTAVDTRWSSFYPVIRILEK
jgi:hypothetical protein